MNLVFMNTMEKKAGDDRVLSAQVVIGEGKGIWHALWSETSEDGYDRQDNWYEGPHWGELITVFRENLFLKLKEGFVPLVTMPWEDPLNGIGKRGRWNAILQCYCESRADEKVMDELRKWRRDKAASLAKAPYMVATNRMLQMVAVFLPQSMEELKQIPGFGHDKSSKYGDEIFTITRKVERKTDFPLDWVEQEMDPAVFRQWVIDQQERKIRSEQEKNAQRRKLLEAIWQGEALDQIAKQTSLPRRDLVLMIESMDQEGYDVSPIIDKELELISKEEKEQALLQFEQQGDRFLKPIFQAIYAGSELKNSESDRVYQWLRLLRIQYRKSRSAQSNPAGIPSEAKAG